MTTTSRFDSLEHVPYGKCLTCGTELATKELSDEHLSSTGATARATNPEGDSYSHSVRITNPDRERRINSAISTIVDDAIQSALDEVEDLISAGAITRGEATSALARCPDAIDAWREGDGDQGNEEDPSHATPSDTRPAVIPAAATHPELDID